ncbi:MAG: thioredoxin domain-containing protein [Rhodospirillaceae bacterium]|nr:thioredoxin domain-containing protein [Rhodospirillaceae bacterium]MBT4588295.1 thioredoxin domain-containing protein [Rhodospirillaceae bacterium]MBT5940203.1 thioredoxin domain-containing protein [Rhodospirillaceae bacterium]MBT7269233.1 thioredoxin domain-containing protein [Rhodospirillaceae bacterium]
MSSNQLKSESSPYLRQHQDNPVHWQAWGDAAFALAKETGKPILLSIGYAACHWCHVMAHESFEDEATADLMNELYVNIKVDREERPDVDSVYMTALAMMGQQGGWPLTMFLTPDGKPYWGGTYFPPTSRYGHPGFSDVLHAVSSLYHDQREKVEADIEAIINGLGHQAELAQIPPGSGHGLHSLAEIDEAAERALSMVDFQNGGMIGAPKFPQPAFQEMLWRAHLRTDQPDFLEAVMTSLTHMCQGGLYDHLGGGFARYSTDAIWLAPHFEKMLYDNAQLIHLMTLVWQKTKAPLLEIRIRETIDWAARELKLDGGGFAGTLDADSPDAEGHSEEGAFYVWNETEIDSVLGADAALFKEIYDISPHGNWEQTNIVNRLAHLDLSDDETEAKLTACRAKLMQARDNRERPGLDDKILADWNGLMIAALSYASLVFEEPSWRVMAEEAFAFVQTDMSNGARLKHSYCAGVAKDADMLDDYAGMIKAALHLHQATGNPAYLDQALKWTETVNAYFWDDAGAGYYLAPHDANDLIARTRTAFDNATPAGNGVMAENLARLFYLTGTAEYQDKADQLIQAFTAKTPDQGANMSSLLAGFETLVTGLQVVIIADERSGGDLIQSAIDQGNPNLILTRLTPNAELPEAHPAQGKAQIDDQPTAYVCHGQTCGLPQTTAEGLATELAKI